HAGYLRRGSRAALDDLDHEVAHRVRSRGIHRANGLARSVASDDFAVGVLDAVHHVRFEYDAARRDRLGRERHLERRDEHVALHDTTKPSSRDPPQRSPPKFLSVRTVCGSGSSVRNGNCLVTSTLPWIAIEAVTVLNVDPGGYTSRHERARSGWVGSSR